MKGHIIFKYLRLGIFPLIFGLFFLFSENIINEFVFADEASVKGTTTIFPAFPMIISLTANDPDGSDLFYSNGDVITVTFDKATNRPPAATKANLLNLFTFSQNLGDDFTGTWISASVLKITIVNANNGASTIGGLTLNVNKDGNLRNQEGTSFASEAVSPTLTGDFGTRAGPSITSLTVVDPKTIAVPGIDAGDVITVRFSENTNKTVNTILNKDALDTLFEYKEGVNFVTLANSYQGTFTNARTLKITILEPDGMPLPTVGGFTLKVKASGRLGDINNLSSPSEAVSPPLSGTFGQKPGPAIIDLVARDPFGSDSEFGIGDTITVSFDAPTNRAAGAILEKSGIDSLFTFSPTLDSQYNGKWFDSQTFVITFTSKGSTVPQVGSFSVKVNEAASLKNKDGSSLASSSSSPFLRGDFGKKPGPEITSAVAADPKDTIMSGVDAGDTITITFNEPTNRPPVTSKSEIDAVFDFSENLGSEYTGKWFNPSKLVITIKKADGNTIQDPPNLTVRILSGGNLKNSANTSSVSISDPLLIKGDFGKKPGPEIISLVAHDPKNTPVPGFDNGDTITVIFSEKTNKPANVIFDKTALDELFTFSQSIGDDYEGVWKTTGDLLITIKDGQQLSEPPVVGQLQLVVKTSGDLRAKGGSEPSTSVSPFLSGNFGRFVEWVSLCEEGDAFTTFPDGKTAEISFAGVDCGGFEFEVADEDSTKFFDILGNTMSISPVGGVNCSEPPFCEVSFVFRIEDIPDDVDDVFTEVKILKDVSGDGIIDDDPAKNEVYNGFTNSTNPCELGNPDHSCVPVTKIISLDSDRFEAKALSPSNSKFAIGGIKALAIGALGPSVNAPSAPSASTASAGAGAGSSGGGGNAGSIGEEGGFAGAIDMSQVKLYEVTWDKCEEKMLKVIAGPAGPGLSVKAVAAMGGIIAMKEAAEQPFTKATVYETPISEIETFIRVQVEGVIGREASLAQRSFDLNECTGGIGGYSESEDIISPASGVAIGSFPSTASLFEDGSMFDIKYNDLDFGVGYWMPQGQITQMDVDEDAKSITFGFSDKIKGRLVLSLPQGMISAENDQFILLNPATSQQISYEIIESGSQYVTLEMTLPEEIVSITVIGTNVVPEFGQIALAILFIVILCIVGISKTKLIPSIKL